jgi:hypothetical protein
MLRFENNTFTHSLPLLPTQGAEYTPANLLVNRDFMDLERFLRSTKTRFPYPVSIFFFGDFRLLNKHPPAQKYLQNFKLSHVNGRMN